MIAARKSISLASQGPPPTLAALEADALEQIKGFLADVEDLASLNATARLFRSPVERALRARIDARVLSHVAALALHGPSSRTHSLLELARVEQGAQRHACVVATNSYGDRHESASAFVDACGGLRTCGEQGWFELYGLVRFCAHPALGHGGDESSAPVLIPRRVVALDGVCICRCHGWFWPVRAERCRRRVRMRPVFPFPRAGAYY
mmetsp:Transcript_6359/g.16256  ORF Transcript_6359/g.16256 Transcript_6359/m.16256 type:complete len:207 (-) Transcript_6359:107-727(-)